MGIKLSVAEEEGRTALSQRLRAAFLFSLGGFLVLLRRIFLPHFFAAGMLFALLGYAVYQTLFFMLPGLLAWVAVGLVCGVCGVLALGYGLAMAFLFTLRAVAESAEDFLYAWFASLKERVCQHVERMKEGVAKQQARVILENSLREVVAPLRAYRLGRGPAVVAGVFLSLLTFVTRSVFLARLARLSGATVNFSALFASRATLVGAIFLNLRWLASLLLWGLYLGGMVTFILCLMWVW